MRLALPVVLVERDVGTVATLGFAHRKHAFRRALDHYGMPTVRGFDQHRHVAVNGVEWYFVTSGPT